MSCCFVLLLLLLLLLLQLELQPGLTCSRTSG
jgi:hypothetical protein